MSARNSQNEYGYVAKTFHWGMALLIIGMLTLGLYMSGLEMSPRKLSLYGWHKSFGALILVLVILRILWRNGGLIPKLPKDMNAFEKFAAHASHYLLYIMMVAMPMVGWLLSSSAGFPVSVFGLFTLPNLVGPDPENLKIFRMMHYYGGFLLIALIVVHAGAALFHHFIRKDNVLRRMLPLVLIMFALPAFAADEEESNNRFTVIPESSGLYFEAKQNNSPVTGEFVIYNADITFDPEHLDQSKMLVTVKMDSVTADYGEVPLTLKTKDWFNVDFFPQATFETKSIKALGGNKYEADAILTIKEFAVPVVLTFTVERLDKEGAYVTGETILRRTQYKIGWDDTSSVQDEVKVTIKINAKREKMLAGL